MTSVLIDMLKSSNKGKHSDRGTIYKHPLIEVTDSCLSSLLAKLSLEKKHQFLIKWLQY